MSRVHAPIVDEHFALALCLELVHDSPGDDGDIGDDDDDDSDG
jgi:hypothetical protein